MGACFLPPDTYAALVQHILDNPAVADALDTLWNPAIGERTEEEVRFALGWLDLWSEEDRAVIEAA